MELFPAQPDLSLQISPPNTKPTSNTWKTSTSNDQDHHDLDLGHYSNPNLTHLTNQNINHLGFLKPIRGVPIYSHNTNVYNHHQSLGLDSCSIAPTINHCNNITQSRFLSPRFSGKRNMRAPRIRWTTTLHDRFVHAVKLLGGHESMSNFL